MTRNRQARAACLALGVLLWTAQAQAFDYLEHAYFTDRACLQAQRRLGPTAASGDRATLARYLALALACPERWDRDYCNADGYKQAEAQLNVLPEPPAVSGDHATTLGDLAASPDHISRLGPVRGLSRAAEPDGMTARLLTWLGQSGDAGGIEADVAEDACETDGLVDWAQLERDLTLGLAAAASGTDITPPALQSAQRRRVPAQGPSDPATAYSFDNPHYLDLVLRNNHHFGPQAYSAFSGLHSTAIALAGSRCTELMALPRADVAVLARGQEGLASLDWEDLPEPLFRARACEVLGLRVAGRLRRWLRRADPTLTAAVRARLQRELSGGCDTDRRGLLEAVVAALMGLTFEGTGLHFLQDGLAAGHVRTPRSARGMLDARYEHDQDNRSGLLVRVRTACSAQDVVLFGDAYLLGRSLLPGARCPADVGDPAAVTACLLRRQRALLVDATAASLLDFALGGTRYDAVHADRSVCSAATPQGEIARHLPTATPVEPALAPPQPGPATLARGALPVPLPPFGYQSLLISSGMDASGGRPQLGMRLVFLSELGARAGWMTSWHFGLLSTLAGQPHRAWTLEAGYLFHFRWAARFLVNAGVLAHLGLRGLSAEVTPFAGLTPRVGISLLPEGWTRIPLEINLAYRPPVTLLDGRAPFSADGIGLEGHFLEVSLGLAFL